MSRQSTTSIPVSAHRSPFLTAGMSNSNVAQSALSMRLLMPTVRQTKQTSNAGVSVKLPSTKSSPSKPRSRAGSVAHSLQPSPDPNSGPQAAVDWVGGGCRFEVVEEQVELDGYQLYAVEKW